MRRPRSASSIPIVNESERERKDSHPLPETELDPEPECELLPDAEDGVEDVDCQCSDSEDATCTKPQSCQQIVTHYQNTCQSQNQDERRVAANA